MNLRETEEEYLNKKLSEDGLENSDVEILVLKMKTKLDAQVRLMISSLYYH